MPERRKPGPKPRGDRGTVASRVPVDQKAFYEERAAEAGLPLSDYVAVLLAQAHGLPVPDYIVRAAPDAHHQQELGISA